MNYTIKIEIKDDRLENTTGEILNHILEILDRYENILTYTISDENTCRKCASEYDFMGQCNCEH